MELNEKLKQLRKEQAWTQEELAEQLFVSRTAISKWESGRGYPSIDSLKALSKVYDVSLDDLLSNEELLSVAENDTHEKNKQFRNALFGLLDVLTGFLLFLPFFGQPMIGGKVEIVSLLALSMTYGMLRSIYIFIVILTMLYGGLNLIVFRRGTVPLFKTGEHISLCLTIVGTIGFIISRQPYAAVYLLFILLIKGISLIYQR